jgi:hypothetical protein
VTDAAPPATVTPVAPIADQPQPTPAPATDAVTEAPAPTGGTADSAGGAIAPPAGG